jgi:phosphoribosyl 1,2-cyclic phosphate phosphodiesterase
MESQPSWRLTLLGTGPSQGVPSLGGPDGHGEWGACDPAEPRNRRTRTSALLDGPDGTRILIDAGPDCRAQLLAAGAGVLDAVIFTHAHADHFMGMDELRQINRNTGQALPVYGFPETLAELQARFDYAFQPVTGGFYRPALTANEILPGEQLVIGQLSLRCLEQDHQVMRTMGIRAGSLAYSTDLVRMPGSTLDALTGLDTWVVGCFRPGPHPVHASLETVASWVAHLRPRRTVLTHMGSAMDWRSLTVNLARGIEPGHDGMRLEPGG